MGRNGNSKAYCATTIDTKKEAIAFIETIIKLGHDNEKDDLVKALLKYINVLHETIANNKKSNRELIEQLNTILNDIKTLT